MDLAVPETFLAVGQFFEDAVMPKSHNDLFWLCLSPLSELPNPDTELSFALMAQQSPLQRIVLQMPEPPSFWDVLHVPRKLQETKASLQQAIR